MGAQSEGETLCISFRVQIPAAAPIQVRLCMFDKLLVSWLQPIEDAFMEYVVSIEGVEYLPLDVFIEVLADCTSAMGSIFLKAHSFIGTCIIFSMAVVVLAYMFSKTKHEIRKSSAPAVEK